MRSDNDDRTAWAVIRDEALRLFADRGPDTVTVRQIATAAGVSPGLVIHHFGSKEGLRDSVDQHVLGSFEALLGGLTAPELYDPAATGSLVEAALRHLPPDSPVPAYLRRLLISDGPAGRRLFRYLFEAAETAMQAMVEAGLAAPGHDPQVRTAFLLCNDLAVFLLRDHIADVLGVDPLSGRGMTRWAREELAVYSSGLGADQ